MNVEIDITIKTFRFLKQSCRCLQHDLATSKGLHLITKKVDFLRDAETHLTTAKTFHYTTALDRRIKNSASMFSIPCAAFTTNFNT